MYCKSVGVFSRFHGVNCMVLVRTPAILVNHTHCMVIWHDVIWRSFATALIVYPVLNPYWILKTGGFSQWLSDAPRSGCIFELRPFSQKDWHLGCSNYGPLTQAAAWRRCFDFLRRPIPKRPSYWCQIGFDYHFPHGFQWPELGGPPGPPFSDTAMLFCDFPSGCERLEALLWPVLFMQGKHFLCKISINIYALYNSTFVF